MQATVIIPTGGRAEALEGTLTSLKHFAPQSEVIVIGNKNDEPTAKLLRESFSNVRYLEAQDPSAVVKRNMGIAKASNDILVFVDDDVVVEINWLSNLLRHYDDGSVGGVGGRVKIPGIGTGPTNLRTGSIRDGFVIGNWNPPITSTIEVQHLLGCNMSFRRDLLVQLGGFDNFFRRFNFREETDLCLRVKGLGKKLLFDPEAGLVHKTRSRHGQGPRWVFYYARNTLYIYLRHMRRTGSSFLRFLNQLFFPPRSYAAMSGTFVHITPATLVAAISGIMAGALGFQAHK